MKKRFFVITAIIFTLCVLAGCGVGEAEITAASVWEVVEAAVPVETLPVMMNIDAAALKAYYGLGDDEVRDFAGKMSLLNVSATEILVARAQRNKGEALLQAVLARSAAIEERFADDEAQLALVRDYRIVQRGDWLLFVISESAGEIADAFDAYFVER